MNVNDKVYIYDPMRQSVYECIIKKIIKASDGEPICYMLTPTNPNLPNTVNISSRHVFNTFEEAFHEAMELDED